MRDTYLITGSAGFIGSNLVRYISYNEKNPIIGIDRLDSTSSMHNVYSNKSHDFYIGDCGDLKFMDRIFALFRPTKIIHLASPSYIKTSEEIKNLETVLSRAYNFNVEKFIYLSSGQVYEKKQDLDKITENGKTCPTSFVSANKIASEAIVLTSKVPYTILRVPEIFGPRQFNGFIPEILKTIKEEYVEIDEDGQKTRDLLYVEDLCNAIIMCSKEYSDNIYNLSFGNDFTDLEIVNMVLEQLKESNTISFSNINLIKRDGEVNSIKLDSTKIREKGWKPQKKIRERLKFTTTWYTNNKWALTER